MRCSDCLRRIERAAASRLDAVDWLDFERDALYEVFEDADYLQDVPAFVATDEVAARIFCAALREAYRNARFQVAFGIGPMGVQAEPTRGVATKVDVQF